MKTQKTTRHSTAFPAVDLKAEREVYPLFGRTMTQQIIDKNIQQSLARMNNQKTHLIPSEMKKIKKNLLNQNKAYKQYLENLRARATSEMAGWNTRSKSRLSQEILQKYQVGGSPQVAKDEKV